MPSYVKEILGYLARWSLFVVAAVFAVALGGLCIHAARVANADMASDILLQDGIVVLRPSVHVAGRPTPPSPVPRVVFWQAGDTARVGTEVDAIWMKVPSESAGNVRTEMAGCPYSSLAALRDTAVTAIAPRGQPLVLIDARLVLPGNSQGHASLQRMLRELQGSRPPVTIAAFFPGLVEELRPLRPELRRALGHVAIVNRQRTRSDASVLQTWWGATLCRGDQVLVITEDPIMAAEARRLGLAVTLVSQAKHK